VNKAAPALLGRAVGDTCITVPHTTVNPNCFTEMCSGSEAGSYVRLIDCVYHSTLGLRVIKRERERERERDLNGHGAPNRAERHPHLHERQRDA